MWGFFLGLAAGTVLSDANRSLARRGLEVLLVTGENAVVCGARMAHRVTVQIREDFEDIMAEARASED